MGSQNRADLTDLHIITLALAENQGIAEFNVVHAVAELSASPEHEGLDDHEGSAGTHEPAGKHEEASSGWYCWQEYPLG